MLFNSFEFLIFFILVTGMFFAIRHKYRWFLLLTASCYFYMAFVPVYILILGFTIVVDYFAGIWIEKTDGKKKRWFLIASLVANIGVLAVFKYYNFLNENITALLGLVHTQNPIPALSILLPIGLSFHTFQAMSYTIEVYRGNQKAERHFGIYALYVMFYPQLVAGPIERPQNILHQFYIEHKFDYTRVTDGLKLMLWGLFKKVVVADRLSVVVDHIYKDPGQANGLTLSIAAVFFSFQIYCDFSGYSDMAIGSAQVMGFKLMDNFNRPYFAKNIAEFWRRWHISLSTWFKDYLYIPLGGNRVVKWRWYYNIFITFLISGLWHGASWNFIIWGALHAVYQIIGIGTKKFRSSAQELAGIGLDSRLSKVLNIGVTFVLVTVAWIFFRVETFDKAWYVLTHLTQGWTWQGVAALGITEAELYNCLVAILILEGVHLIQRHHSIRHMLSDKPLWLRWGVYYLLIFLIVFMGKFEHQVFIYFQF
ncbi:MAG: MBOAT family protein [Bacteroidia bacterium]|nr:MBOAT family protein [Bacteroidia bacterium]